MHNYILEVCCFNLESCLTAASAGAQRIELCSSPAEGGTTPGFGTISLVREKTDIQLYPIIRPRGGDFLYSQEEFEIMKREVRHCREMRCDGVVIGILTRGGKVDKERTKELVQIAGTMGVTFHRAFDRTEDIFSALENLIECGCDRVLTSGGYPTAPEGIDVLKQLVYLAGDRITVMPGSGVRSSNIGNLISTTNAREYHSSARRNKLSEMLYRTPHPSLNENHYPVADREELERIVALLKTDHFGSSATAS